MHDPYAHCESLVRANDKDRFIAGLFAPAALRRHLYALYAFDLEISRVGSAALQPLAGEIRLQWWREVLEGSRAEEAAANPVAAAILDTIVVCHVPAEKLLALIDAHAFDLYDEPMPSLSELEAYARNTAGTVLELGARILDRSTSPTDLPSTPTEDVTRRFPLPLVGRGQGWGSASGPVASANNTTPHPKPPPQGGRENQANRLDVTYAPVAQAAAAAGQALVLTQILRELPARTDRSSFIPQDLLRRHGANREDLEARRDSANLRAVLVAMREQARASFAAFRVVAPMIPADCAAAFLPIALVPPLLKKPESAASPFSVVDVAPWRRQWLLWRAARNWPNF